MTIDTTRRTILTGGAALGLAAGLVHSATAEGETPAREFEGKTAFVTGGARGIGLGCAEALAARGANILLFDIATQIPEVPYPLASADDLAAAKTAIEAHGVQCLAVTGDVRDFDAQKAAMDRAVSELGGLDFIVANAGITQPGSLEQFSEEELSLIIDINLKGVIKTIQAATPILREQGSGSIVTMASVTGRSGSDRFPVYSATKWAIIGLTKSAALALGPDGVRVNALCPTLCRTPLLENDHVLSNMIPGVTLTWDQFEEVARDIHVLPVGFYGPEYVGSVAAFLCSEASAMISGDVFDIGAGANANFPA
ncbi:SDR family NAD(P)-dependent oxidoreductase [Oricola sp.]|uniref:SDR family NAD(P)-dependent oxidoreductase n=1 Tax=Oricola sp. TaxID=1979950 RepID=UPI003BA8C818